MIGKLGQKNEMRTILLASLILAFVQPVLAQEKTIMDTTKHQSPMLGLRTTIYKVGEIDRAKAWYAEAFQTAPYFDQPFYVGFNIGGFELGLQPEENPTIDKPESVVTYWGVEDIQKEYRRLIALGAAKNEKPYSVGGELMTATVKDPWGNVIGLIYNPYYGQNE